MTYLIKEKLLRLRAGEPPQILDLFSGCGGLTLGFEKAGFRSLAGIDSDPLAALSYAWNFHAKAPSELQGIHSTPRDVALCSPTALLESLGQKCPEKSVDVLIGGPPCPAFTRIGRAKLREVQGNPLAYKGDPRARLFEPFVDQVAVLHPLAVVMENVPDILNWGGVNIGEQICVRLESLGYRCSYSLLNSASYGVPQLRERFFLVALHESVGPGPGFPAPTHQVRFPIGYVGVRDVALRSLRHANEIGKHYVEVSPGNDSFPPAVTAREAIGDLPALQDHLTGCDVRGARRFDKPMAYERPAALNAYVELMRNWPGHQGGPVLYDHVTRSLSARDYRLFEAMQPGDDYPAAVKLAEKLFAEAQERVGWSSNGHGLSRSDYIPPYDVSKFPNKWRKLEPDKPARTLMAHIGRDTYSHIHFDSNQARVISVREAARLQSFPDGFRFAGTMNPAYTQIGNAVPPLLAFAIANQVRAQLTDAAVTHPMGQVTGVSVAGM